MMMTMTMTLLIAATALQTLPSPALERWEVTFTDSRGESAVDPESISRSGDEVTANVRTRLHRAPSTGQPVGGVMRYVFNCRTSSARLERADLYDGAGAFVTSHEERLEEQTVRPGTPVSTTMERVCRADAN